MRHRDGAHSYRRRDGRLVRSAAPAPPKPTRSNRARRRPIEQPPGEPLRQPAPSCLERYFRDGDSPPARTWSRAATPLDSFCPSATERTVPPLLVSMENGELVEHAAREAIRQHGHNAVAVLLDRADTADEQGDRLSAEAWRDIADEAERILRETDQAGVAPAL